MANKRVLLVVDMQHDFMDFEDSALPIPGSSEIIPKVNEFIQSCRPNEYELALFTQDWHSPERVEYDPDGNPFPKHCVKDTKGAELVINPEQISRPIPVFGLHKDVFNMWEEENLTVFPRDHLSTPRVKDRFGTDKPYRDDVFQKLYEKSIKEVDVLGVASDICVDQAISGLVERGFVPKIYTNLTKGIFKSMESVIKEKYNFKVVPTTF